MPTDPHGWLVDSTKEALLAWLEAAPANPVVIELGTWLGASARLMLDKRSDLTLICVDTWLGSREHHHPDNPDHVRLPTLYETFLANMWQYRDRLVPVRADTASGLGVVHDLGVWPDMVYVDAGHGRVGVYADVRDALDLFPQTHLIGDDWGHLAVQAGVRQALDESLPRRNVAARGNTWWSPWPNSK